MSTTEPNQVTLQIILHASALIKASTAPFAEALEHVKQMHITTYSQVSVGMRMYSIIRQTDEFAAFEVNGVGMLPYLRTPVYQTEEAAEFVANFLNFVGA